MSIDLSLDRIRVLLKKLPAYTRPTCHIAGTNGKGSVSALLTSIFRASSYRIGRFNSPHLVSVYDSITVDDIPVNTSVFDKAKSRVEKANADSAIGASNFELLTATALLILEEAKVDIAVIEVGMGGRLDATNVISDENILVSALTAVDLDHQAFLGTTVSEIAKEKAAIVRSGKPFVLGPQKHAEVENVVANAVGLVGGDFIKASVPFKRRWDPLSDGNFHSITSFSPNVFSQPPPQPVQICLPCFSDPLRVLLPLQGDHQLQNLGTALSVVSALLTHPSAINHANLQLKNKVTIETVSKGVRNTRWPGRLSFHQVNLPTRLSPDNSVSSNGTPFTVLVDGAHNPSSSTTLNTYISSLLTQLVSSSESPQTPPGTKRHRTINLTYILALSHSPPKTPIQTLSPLIPPQLPKQPSHPNCQFTLKLNIAVLRFTPPEGMPWVKSVPPSELREVVSALVGQEKEKGSSEVDVEFWSPDDSTNFSSIQEQLPMALNWAASSAARKTKTNLDENRNGGLEGGGGIRNNGDLDNGEEESLIIIAGSLYLVADFYRLIGYNHV
ncbi:folylpolyglutamate synthase family protein [Abortiporus biennis]